MESPDLIRNKYRQYPWDRPNFVAPLTSVPGNLAGGRLGKVKARSRLRYKGGREGQRSKKLRALCTTFNYLVQGAKGARDGSRAARPKLWRLFIPAPLQLPLRPPCLPSSGLPLSRPPATSLLCFTLSDEICVTLRGANKSDSRATSKTDTFAARRRPSSACNIRLSI